MRLQAWFVHLEALLLASTVACKEPSGASTTGGATTGEPATSTTSSTTTSGSTSGTSSSLTSGPPPTGSGESSPPDDSGAFALMPDLPPVAACDVWNDTCPRGQKCVPYAGPMENPGCVDVVDDPIGLNEPCDSTAPVDACEPGTLCYGFAQGGDAGRCLATCEGGPDDASCADACSNCFINGGKDFGTCPVQCDPRAPDCPEHLSCVAFVFQPNFLCAAADQATIPAGMSCMNSFRCQMGTTCTPAMFLPACDGDNCCAPVCDLKGPDTCAGSLPGAVCKPWPTWYPEFNASCLPDGLGLCGAPE